MVHGPKKVENHWCKVQVTTLPAAERRHQRNLPTDKRCRRSYITVKLRTRTLFLHCASLGVVRDQQHLSVFVTSFSGGGTKAH